MGFYDEILKGPDEHMRALGREHKERAAVDFRPLELAGMVEDKQRKTKDRSEMSIGEMVAENLAHPERMSKEHAPGSIAELVFRKQEEQRKGQRTNKALDAMEQETSALTASLRELRARLGL